MVASLSVTAEISFQNIGKEEEPKDGKHDKQFYKDDPPEFPSPGHIPEAIVIKPDYLLYHGRVDLNWC